MSGRIRKQLGPARKRLSDRIAEASNLLEDGDISRMKTVKYKLVANLEYHAKLTGELGDIDDASDDEQKIIDGEIERCTLLEMDAQEMCVALTENVKAAAEVVGDDEVTKDIKVKERDKVTYEIEKLKIEMEYKRAELEQLKLGGNGRNERRDIKLPIISLEKFSGKVIEWPSFWDSFSSTIHLNGKLSKVDKFKYLVSCLEGEAKDALKGFNLTEAQYDEAVKHLQRRYDDREYIIHQHYNALATLPKCAYNTYELRRTFNYIETQIRSLRSMGEDGTSNYLVALIKSKLPEELNIRLEETKDGDWTVDRLRKSIEKFILARERSEESSSSSAPPFGYSGEGLLSRDANIQCLFCEKKHWSDECQKYKTLEQRKMQIRGRCFICLSDKHLFRQCKSERQCFYCKRKFNHHSALCPSKFGVLGDPKEDELELVELGQEVSRNIDNEVVMKTVRVAIQNTVTGKREFAMALLDTGAKRTYISTEKAKRLGLNWGPPNIVKLNTFGSGNTSEMYVNKTNFAIKLKDGSSKSINAKVCNTITGPVVKQKLNFDKYKRIWKDLDMADNVLHQGGIFNIDILIGNDYYDDIVKSEKIELEDGLYLINSSVGWMFSGRVKDQKVEDVEEQEISMLVDEKIDFLQRFWEVESIGIQNATDETENEELLSNFRETLTKNGNRYQVQWPWKISKYELPDNYKLAEARLKSLISSLQKDEDSMIKYDEIIRKQLTDGIIEEADNSKEYVQQDDVVTHYIPHHMVKSSDGKKVRIVYEGCAKTHKSKRSINDCLHRGKNMVANMIGVLLRFRMNKIALTADIEKAYLQLELNPSDRDVTRFLWLKNTSQPCLNSNIQEYRFCRVIWGIISASFLLASTIYYHLNSYNTETSCDIMKNLYVDNLISGTTSVKSAIAYYHETKKIFNEASMNMREWISNDDEVMRKINDGDKCERKVVKILGVIWKIEEDVIHLAKPNSEESNEVLTKRRMLQKIASVFDPMGIVSPVMLQFKLLMQALWKAHIQWDAVVPTDISCKWKEVVNELSLLETINIQRCIDTENNRNGRYELITFTDASINAYAAAVYLRIVREESVQVNLVYAKSRLSPIKEMSIPRLELLGVLVGCRASHFVAQELGIPDINQILLTDSKCVIEWCKSKKELNRFVRDKVTEIRSHDISLGYVKSEENPADIATRGQSVKKLKNNHLWWEGPKWLSVNNHKLVEEKYDVMQEARDAIKSEEKVPEVLHETGLISTQAEDVSSPFEIKETKFSSYLKLIHVTAWCIRFINNMKREDILKGSLSPKELQLSRDMWTKFIQKKHFPQVIKAIEDGKYNLIKNNLGVRKDEDEILRCIGRFQFQQKSPKLLPKDSHLTNMIIKRDHQRLLHAGVSQTLSEVRNEFWVIQGRSAVRKVIRQCLICIFWEGGPFKTPKFAPLPEFVTSSNMSPFTFVGLDYMGPIQIICDKTLTKNWVCLFTCVNTRAIHLELVENMSTDGFLLCMRRFIARRGKPLMVISDNADQIKLGNSVIDKLWNNVISNRDVQSYIADEGIKWKYVVEYSPWKGGFYERLVGITKCSLRKSLGKRLVDGEKLLTLLVETEAVINSRPLTYLDDDINSGKALTPSHFLTSNYKTGVPDVTIDYEPKESSSTVLLKAWKKGQATLNHFWEIWSTQYLQTLRDRHTPQMRPVKGEIIREPQLGEIVLIKEEGLPRGRWKVARIEKLIKSETDGVTRAASVVTASGKVYKRPLRLLYPLECSEIDEQSAKQADEQSETNDKETIKGRKSIDTQNNKPKRKAAVIAREKIKNNAIDDLG